ncbi:hypothetical protein CRE_13278 [Caenorhabditis remanei]|uniref:Uncharacterized protein n=1 Tax=Caenorhabditis remanei TaxID=31234 RepID=E3M8G7_CAERE|nr:hypothetical protein CRE_13278 [Caenorhabditis remanei]
MQNNNTNQNANTNPFQFPHPNFPMQMFMPGTGPSTSATPFQFLQNAVYPNGMGAFWNPAVIQNFAMLNQKAMNMMLPQPGLWNPTIPVAPPTNAPKESETTVSPSQANTRSPSPKLVQPEPIEVVKETKRESTPPVDVVSVSPEGKSSADRERSRESSNSRFDYDEGNDDVDNMFGISFSEKELSPSSDGSRVERCLSPIAFTPPDSPQHHLSFDEILGIGSTVKPQEIPKAKTPSPPKPSSSKTPTNFLKMDEEEFIKNYVQPKKVPIYKQKAALLLLEDSKKKNDSNYDVFDFDMADEEDRFVEGKPAEKSEKVEKEMVAKSVYIPGVGFEVKNDKDGNVRKAMARPKDQTAFISDHLEFSLADKIRAERNLHTSCSFLKIMELFDTDCAKNMRKVTAEEPLLPKFTIKIDQLKTVNKKRTIKSKKRKSTESISDDEEVRYSKKAGEVVYSILRTSDTRPSALNFPVGPGVSEEERRRLDMFGPADGILPKDAYLVLQSDILKWDCPIWKVDNQTLLRKFTPLRAKNTGKLVYTSTTTYSGWYEQIKHQYFRVSVRVMKSSRYGVVLEPEIPLNEVFCASAMEWFKNPRCFLTEEPITKNTDSDFLKEPRQKALHTLLNICLVQALTRKYVKSLRDKNDWSYTHAAAEIEKNNQRCEDLIQKRIRVDLKLKIWIGSYTRLVISKTSYHCLTTCQICNLEKSQNILSFFDKTEYDLNLTVDSSTDNSEKENQDPLVVNVISCEKCSMSIDFLHKMHHLQFHILRVCEDKLELIGTTEVDLTAKELIKMAKSDEAWVFGVIQMYCDIWDTVIEQFSNIC